MRQVASAAYDHVLAPTLYHWHHLGLDGYARAGRAPNRSCLQHDTAPQGD